MPQAGHRATSNTLNQRPRLYTLTREVGLAPGRDRLHPPTPPTHPLTREQAGPIQSVDKQLGVGAALVLPNLNLRADAHPAGNDGGGGEAGVQWGRRSGVQLRAGSMWQGRQQDAPEERDTVL